MENAKKILSVVLVVIVIVLGIMGVSGGEVNSLVESALQILAGIGGLVAVVIAAWQKIKDVAKDKEE